jgi:UPF0716 protein FxsA
MSLVKWTFIGLLALPAAEILTFILVAALIGWLWAAIFFIGTSVAGVALLRRSGRADLDRLRTAFARDGISGLHLETPGAATMLGGILLTFPGFITDLMGAALFVPWVRRWATTKLATLARSRRRGAPDDHIIDLEPGEWHQIPDQKRRRTGKPKDGLKRGT